MRIANKSLNDSILFSLNYLILELFDGKENAEAALKSAAKSASEKSKATGVKPTNLPADISQVLDRMGHLVLAVKAGFDRKASESGLVSATDATSKFLFFV